jgi:hypothetical protein
MLRCCEDDGFATDASLTQSVPRVLRTKAESMPTPPGQLAPRSIDTTRRVEESSAAAVDS